MEIYRAEGLPMEDCSKYKKPECKMTHLTKESQIQSKDTRKLDEFFIHQRERENGLLGRVSTAVEKGCTKFH